MSGAGSSPAGIAPAGSDPAEKTGQAVGKRTPLVAYFDIKVRGFPRDPTTGKILLVHWVDQAVALAMGVTEGTLKSQPSLGNRIRLIKRNSGRRIASQVEDEVKRCLRALIERGDIGITQIYVDAVSKRSQLLVALDYVNRRTVPQAPRETEFIY